MHKAGGIFFPLAYSGFFCYTCGMEKGVVSVIIPTYNRAALITRAINSVLKQSVKNTECIVVDDGSSDDTGRIVQAIKDSRIVYERLKVNGGSCAARNRGTVLAKGEYIAFLDSDDVWHEDYIEKQLLFIKRTVSDAVICRMECFSETGERMHYFPNDSVKEGILTYTDFLRYNAASTQILFARAQCFNTVQFDDAMPRMQDWDIALRLSKEYKVSYQRLVLADTYLQKDSITRRPERGVDAMDKIFKKNGDAILLDKTAAVNFFRKKAAFMKQSGINPLEAYRSAVKYGGGAKDFFRAVAWQIAAFMPRNHV